MAVYPKWEGAVGYVRVASATATDSSPDVWPVAESADAPGVPQVFRRNPTQTPDTYNINRAGENYSFTVEGMQGSCHDWLYTLACFSGDSGYGFSTPTHTINPADHSEYLNYLIDRALDLGTSTPTQHLSGVRIGQVTIEQPTREYAKMSLNGLACRMESSLVAPLTPVIPTGADDEPLSWASIANTGGAVGHFKIGYDTQTPSAEDNITSFKIELSRNQSYARYGFSSNQAGEINEGHRTVTCEIQKEFAGTDAKNAFLAWKNNQYVHLDVKWAVGAANYVRIVIPYMRIMDAFAKEIGASDDAIMGTLMCEAYRGGTNLYTVTGVDGSPGARYW